MLLVLQSGCAREVGQPIDMARADILVPGKSTLADAVELLGPPSRTKASLSGNTARWRYLRNSPTGTQWSVLDIRFAADGTMVGIVKRSSSDPKS